MEKFSRCKQAKYQITYDRMFDRKFNSIKVAEFVEMNAFLPPEQGLTRYLEKFLENPEFSPIDWRSEAIKDRYSGEMAGITEIGHWKQIIKYLIYRFIKP
jgi:hypothetical protein